MVIWCFSRPVARSYRYRWPQLSRSDHQTSSFDAGSARQSDMLKPVSRNVWLRSSRMFRTAPVVASATRSVSCLWSREVERKYSFDVSGLHSTSANVPLQYTWSQMLDRCGSAGMSSRITFGPSTSMTTRWIVKIFSSPGSGYAHCSSSGWPTFVRTRYMSPTPRASCWNVAILRESGDQSSTGRGLFVHPALLVA